MARNHALSLPRVADSSVFHLSSREKCWAQYYGRPWNLPFHGRQILDRQHRSSLNGEESGRRKDNKKHKLEESLASGLTSTRSHLSNSDSCAFFSPLIVNLSLLFSRVLIKYRHSSQGESTQWGESGRVLLWLYLVHQTVVRTLLRSAGEWGKGRLIFENCFIMCGHVRPMCDRTDRTPNITWKTYFSASSVSIMALIGIIKPSCNKPHIKHHSAFVEGISAKLWKYDSKDDKNVTVSSFVSYSSNFALILSFSLN